MDGKGAWLSVLFVVAAAAAPWPIGPAWAQQAGPQAVVLNLQEAVKRAVSVSAEVRQMQAAVEAAAGKRDQADAARYPQIELISILGPSQKARQQQAPGTPPGVVDPTSLSSPDPTNKAPVSGIFGRGDLRVIQPIYTFGKITAFREAAAEGIKVEQARVDEKRADIVLRTKQLYYGLLLAQDSRELVLDIKDQLERALEKVEELLKANAPGADQVDLYKLRSFRGALDKGIGEAEKGIKLAKAALRAFLNLAEGTDVQPADRSLQPESRPVPALERNIAEAREKRPEYTQIRAGLRATEFLVEAERANYYPQFFVALIGALSGATNRDFIENPFVGDPFHERKVGVVAGFQWHFDFGITAGKVRTARAEHLKVQRIKEVADTGIPLQVEKAMLELEEAVQGMRATEDAYLNARKWLVAAVANFDLGIGEAKDVADAVVAYAKMRSDNFQAIYNYNIALGNLEHVTGRDVAEGQ